MRRTVLAPASRSPVGPQGDAQVYSLSPTKLVVAGEGGIVATNSDELAEKIRRGREYGMGNGYDSLFAGLNARMSEFHACLGTSRSGHVGRPRPPATTARGVVAVRARPVTGNWFQEVLPGTRSSYKDFSITVGGEAFGLARDELAKALAAENIDTRKYYDPPVHGKPRIANSPPQRQA